VGAAYSLDVASAILWGEANKMSGKISGLWNRRQSRCRRPFHGSDAPGFMFQPASQAV